MNIVTNNQHCCKKQKLYKSGKIYVKFHTICFSCLLDLTSFSAANLDKLNQDKYFIHDKLRNTQKKPSL